MSVPSSMGGFKWRLPESFCRYRILPQTYCDACKFTHGVIKNFLTKDNTSTQSWAHVRGRAHDFIRQAPPCSARPSACLPPQRLTSHLWPFLRAGLRSSLQEGPLSRSRGRVVTGRVVKHISATGIGSTPRSRDPVMSPGVCRGNSVSRVGRLIERRQL